MSWRFRLQKNSTSVAHVIALTVKLELSIIHWFQRTMHTCPRKSFEFETENIVQLLEYLNVKLLRLVITIL